MITVEFEGALNPDDSLTVPPEVASQLKNAQSLRVIVVLPESEDENDWKALTVDQFLSGYDEGDAIYDQLSPR